MQKYEQWTTSGNLQQWSSTNSHTSLIYKKILKYQMLVHPVQFMEACQGHDTTLHQQGALADTVHTSWLQEGLFGSNK